VKSQIHTLTRDPRNGYYSARIQINGKIKRFRFGTSKKQAEDDLRKLESKIAKGEISFATHETSQVQSSSGKKDIRLEELIHRHLAWVESNRAIGTLGIRQHYLNQFLAYTGPSMVSGITISKLEDFRTWSGKQSKLSINHGSEALRHVKSMLIWGERNEVCNMPVKHFPEIKFNPSSTKLVTTDDIAALFNAAPPDFKDMINFNILTGLRPQELRMLKPSQVISDLTGGFFLLIEKHKTARHSIYPKPRKVPLSSAAVEIYLRSVQSHPTAEYIFLNADGNPYTARTYRQRFKRLCKKVGIAKPPPPYALRHLFATIQAIGGINQSILKQVMGHSKIQTTDRYVAPVDEASKAAVSFISEKLNFIMAQSKASGISASQNGDKNGRKPVTKPVTELGSEIDGKTVTITR